MQAHSDWSVKAVQSAVFQAYLAAQELQPALVVGADFAKLLEDYEDAVKDILEALQE